MEYAQHELVLLDELFLGRALRIALADTIGQQHRSHEDEQRIDVSFAERAAEKDDQDHDDARRKGQRGQALRIAVALDPLGRFAAVIAELSRLAVADPFHQRERQALTGDLPIGIAARPGDAHDVADPAQFGVLRLQEIVVRELGFAVAGDAGGRQIELHAQAFRQRAVVQVLAMPALALRQHLRARGQREKQQEPDHVDLLGAQVREQDEHEAHQEGEEMRDPQDAQGQLLVVDRQPVGHAEDVVDICNASRQPGRIPILQ